MTSAPSTLLVHNAYGKSEVRLTKIIRQPDHQEVKEISVNIELEGDFSETYMSGDNSKVVATDSMKNTVYALAAQHPLDSIESFANHLAKHFLKRYEQISQATVQLRESLWNRVVLNGNEHPHAFTSAGNERRSAVVKATRENTSIQSGIENLVVLKTTNSEFWGFVRDEYTTLPETRDRIFATAIEATWAYGEDNPDFNKIYDAVRNIMLEVFATHRSLSVQQTLYEMGRRALDACDRIEEITIRMPNQHHIAMNLTPFGLETKNEIFVPTDEPYGLITGTLRRP
ncbi:MAG: urate oxidase [Pyrinomonadaceae bacterium]|nr:urate oxidase [Pyrinomonadaceae bacterium]